MSLYVFQYKIDIYLELYFSPSNNPSTYCRLCFMIGDRNLVALFPVDSEPRHFLIEQILEFTGIQIKPRDDAYGHICWRCAVTLEDFQLFRQRSLEHDAVIRTTILSEIEDANDTNLLVPMVNNDDVVADNHSELLGVCQKDELSQNIASVTENDQPQNVILAASSGENDGYFKSDSSEPSKAEPAAKNFTCHICKTEFGSQQAMFAHFKEQHSDRGRPHKCTLCPAAFKRKGHLEDHVSSHLGEMRYVCKDCGAKYAKSKSLLRHRKLYHQSSLKKTVRHPMSSPENSRFICLYCPKAFKHRPSLNFHVKSHYEMLPYVCDICDARFAYEQGMLVHKGKYHPQNPADKFFGEKGLKNMAKCDYCPRYFSKNCYLLAHVREMHLISWREKLKDEQEKSDANKLEELCIEDEVKIEDTEIND